MSVYYLDTSAALKLLAEEEDHALAFAAFYDENPGATWVSSTLLRVEMGRAVRRTIPAAWSDAVDLLQAFDYITMDDAVVDAAMHEPEPQLRSLDAIHLATARLLAADLTAFITYDDRLASAAEQAGLEVHRPQDS